MRDTSRIRTSGQRLCSRLEEMAAVGATPRGGCNRQALTDEDRAGRQLFLEWCRRAGCDVRVDEVGNLFARRPGLGADTPPVLAGSHLDTQPTGGRFDGVYGVLAALEVVETLNDHDLETRAPVEIVSWTNEEGSRFSGALTGSAVWSGVQSLAEARALETPDGTTFGQELERTGFVGPTAARFGPLRAFFEIHIEQGPILETEGKTIGVVTGVQHMSRHRIRVHGQEAHAGTTPMHLRRDPMQALSHFLPRLYRLARDQGPESRLTFGVIHASPASSNTVPGQLDLSVDLRHPDREAYDKLVQGCDATVAQECRALNLESSIECLWEAPGVDFDPQCIAIVRQAAQRCGYPWQEMRSGAGHDAMNVARVAPTSMIFIPCKDGLSHNEAESATPQDLEAGANVLLHAVLDAAADQP